MINIFSDKISTKDLYLVTIKKLIDVRYVKGTWETIYLTAKENHYTICRKKYNTFYDIFSKNKYEYFLNTKKGTYGVKNETALDYKEKYTTKEELAERLKLIKEQAEKLRTINNQPKTKKLIPFPKKY